MTYSLFFIFTYILPISLIVNLFYVHGLPSILQIFTSFALIVLLTGTAMSSTLHRYFSHSAYKTSRAFQLVLAIFSTFAYQGGPIWWASKHRRHHKHCDDPNDPHSVVQSNFFYAFVGWTMMKSEQHINTEFVGKFMTYPELVLVDKFWYIFPWSGWAISLLYLGYYNTCVLFIAPMLGCRLITLLFNVEYHTPNRNSIPGKCLALDTARFLGDCVGESGHAIHHIHPSEIVRQSLGPPYFDIPYYLYLKPLLLLGLIWT